MMMFIFKGNLKRYFSFIVIFYYKIIVFLFILGGIIMTDFFNWLAYDILWGPPLIILMIFTGLYFTIRSKFFQVAHFKYI